MTTLSTEPQDAKPSKGMEDASQPAEEDSTQAAEEKDQRKRRLYLLLLLLLLLLCCCISYFFVRYLLKPQPLPQMVPVVNNVINYPPTYKFSIVGVDRPVGVAASPDNQRLYVAESGGAHLIKMFDRSGNLIGSFSPYGTTDADREPIYLAVDPGGRVYVVDRYNNAIDLFDANGNYLDAIIAPDMTLTKFLATQIPGGVPSGTKFSYDGVNLLVSYQLPGQSVKKVKFTPPSANWAPVGIRFDTKGDLIYTDITKDFHSVHIIPAADVSGSWLTFNPQVQEFGSQGKDPGQLQFPNSAVTDSKGDFYVSDGDNARIVEFGSDLKYLTIFGFGTGDNGLNLPRGMWMDSKDHLHVVDAVGAVVRVYDVSGSQPQFLYNFGTPGNEAGQFNFPIDIGIDGTGRLYIADRDNDRIEVWSY